MNNQVQAPPERGRIRAQQARIASTSLPMLLVLSGLLVWAPVRAGAQVFAIKTIGNTNVLVGTPITIQVSVTNTTGASSQLTWNLSSNPAVSPTATITPIYTGPQGPTTFKWTPTQAQVVIFTVSVSQFETTNTSGTSFTVTVTNSVTPVGKIVIDTIPPQTVAQGATLTFTNHAHATDNPANALVFRLVNAPSGATMTSNSPTSAVFTWTPTAAQALNPSYTIREIVTEPSTSVSNYQDFQVTITRTNNCAQLDEFLAAVQDGGYFLLTNCTTIVLSNTLTISGSGTLDAGTANVTISGNNSFRLFTVLPGVNYTLRGITLSGGQDVKGGGLYISEGAVVLLTNCTLAANRATGSNGVAGTVGSSDGIDGGNGGNGTAGKSALGGAIHNLGDLTALNCQFLTNSASGGTGGAGGGGGNGTGTLSSGGDGGNGGNGGIGDGGAIYNAGSLSLSNCTFSGNSASGGSGGVGGTNGTGRRFAGAPGTGGAGMEGSGAAVYSANHAVILNCTFASNVGQGGDSASGGTDSNADGAPGAAGANSLGGGIYNVRTGFLTNCTFSGNQVTGGNGGDGGTGTGTLSYGGNGGNGGYGLGGGLFNAGSIVVVNCTFSGCGGVGGTNGLAGSGRFDGTDGTPGLGLGGDIAQGSGSFVLRNTILAASSAGGNAFVNSLSHITDGGYNLSSDASLNLSATGSHKNTDPKLAALTDNDGPTQTMAIPTNSPAYNKIPAAIAPTTDQRGIPRPQGISSDIGAYELGVPPAILTQPQSQTIAQGSNAKLTVSAFGAPLAYQWRFDGTNIPDETSSAYNLPDAQATDTGYYDVIVTNNYGSVTSKTALLSVAPFTISGQVLAVDRTNGLRDALVQAISGSATSSTNTGDDGYYTLSGLASNTYSVVASLTCFRFPSNTVTVGRTNAIGVNFFATNVAYTIRGHITNGAAGLANVIVTASGTTPAAPAVTDTNGLYEFSGLCAGPYTVTPSADCYSMTPSYRPVTVGSADTNGVDFGASTVAYTISGLIVDAPVGVTLALNNTNGLPPRYVTNSGNSYGFSNLCRGRYFVVPSLQGYQFKPSTTNMADIPPSANSVNFTAWRVFSISGRILAGTNGGAVTSGTVTAKTNSVIVATVGVSNDGTYIFTNLPAANYSVTPTLLLPCYHLNVTNQLVPLETANVSGVDFVALRDAYTISGRITDGGIGISNATVQAGTQTTNTDSGGNYVLSGLCSGSYTVTPVAACRRFTPDSIPVDLRANTGGVNFVTFSNNLSRIRGRVTDGVNGLSNVLVTATGGSTSISDPNGNYVLASLCPGAYAVTPSLSNYCFNPQSLTVSVGSAQTTNLADLVATPGVYRISGTLDGMPLGPTVRVSLSAVTANGTNPVAIASTTNGAYVFPSVCPGAYLVTPSNACFQFYPPSWSTTVGPNDDSLNFAVSGGSAFAIRGQVTQGGVGLSNVTVSAGGQTYVTGSDGNYAVSYLCQGTYPVTASSPNFQFAPPTNYVTLSAADSNGVNFAATAVFSLSGQVLQGTNGLPGVKVAVGTNLSYTGPGGYYTNYHLREGTNVVVPSLDGYAFAPATQSLTLASNTSGLNFMAFPSLALTRTTNGWVQLAFAGAFTCGVEASPNLKSWQPVFTTNNISTNTLILEFVDTNAPAFPRRFYRLTETFTGLPVLTNWAASPSSVSLDGIAAQILACQIEASTDLKSWIPISTNSLPTNSIPFQFRYSETSNSPVRFYRLFQAPGF